MQVEPPVQTANNPLASKFALLDSIPGLKTGATIHESPVVPLPLIDMQAEDYEIPICGIQWWEDGEHYECLMDKGHKSPKHGQHGAVSKIDE